MRRSTKLGTRFAHVCRHCSVERNLHLHFHGARAGCRPGLTGRRACLTAAVAPRSSNCTRAPDRQRALANAAPVCVAAVTHEDPASTACEPGGNDAARPRCGGQRCGGLRSRLVAARPPASGRRPRGRVVCLGGAALPARQRGLRGRGQSRRRHAGSAETADSARRRGCSSRDHHAAAGRRPGLRRPVAPRRRPRCAAAGAPRALPLRTGPPTRPTPGDTGGDGGQGVAAGGRFRPAHWSRTKRAGSSISSPPSGRSWAIRAPRRPSTTP